MMRPFSLSVVMPFYNHKQYLEESLGSIASQSLRADEILIVDDGSTDGSETYLPEYQKRFPSIRVIRNEVNRGIAYTFNRGVQEAKGEFIILCPADDLLMPGFFEECRKAFLKYPELGIFCGDTSLFPDRMPYEFKKVNILPFASDILLAKEDVIKYCRNQDFFLATNSAMYQRELVLKYGGYDSKLLSLMDTFLNYQIVLRHPIVYKPQIYSAFRLVSNSYGSRIRFNWKLRLQLLSEFVRKTDQSDAGFRKDFMRAGIFSLGGFSMLLYLSFKPKFWKYLPFLFFKLFRQKLKKKHSQC